MTSRLSFIKRICPIQFHEARAIILFGPRKSGKTSFLKQKFSKAMIYDLLHTDLRTSLTLKPSLLREEVLAKKPKLVILDEIQKIPTLLDEVHWLIENTSTRFILCGSSPRKLKRGAANLLGGRALKINFFPLVYPEIPDFNLEKALNQGFIPQHYLSQKYEPFLRSYVEQYLQEEVIEESQIRKLQSFYRFLEVAGLMNGELLNYAKVASDCGVSAKSVREYYQVLEDTLIGFTLMPWAKVKTRKLIETAKFYLFDIGVVKHLKGIKHVPPKTREFGNLFETFLLQEVRAYNSYKDLHEKLYFWRTKTDFEVDLIIGSMLVAIEFKATENPSSDDLKGLKYLLVEHKPMHALLVCQTVKTRKTEEGIIILNYKDFLKQLWKGAYF